MGRNEHAGVCGTGLAAVEHTSAKGALHRSFKVCVVQNDTGRFPAQFQRHALDGLAGQLAHTLASPGRSGEADHVNFQMRGEHLADHGPQAIDKVEHAWRQPRVMNDFGQNHGVDRRDFARFEHHCAARHHRGRNFQGDLAQRKVPGRDAAHNTNRLTRHHRVTHFLLPLKLASNLGKITPMPRRAAHLNGTRHFQRHPYFPRNRQGQLIGTRLDASSHLVQIRSTRFDRQCGPGFKSRARGHDGCICL